MTRTRNLESASRLGSRRVSRAERVPCRNGSVFGRGRQRNLRERHGSPVNDRKGRGTERGRITDRRRFRFRSLEIGCVGTRGSPDVEARPSVRRTGTPIPVRSPPRNGTAAAPCFDAPSPRRTVRLVHFRSEARTKRRRITGDSDVPPMFSRDRVVATGLGPRCRGAGRRDGGGRVTPVNRCVPKRHAGPRPHPSPSQATRVRARSVRRAPAFTLGRQRERSGDESEFVRLSCSVLPRCGVSRCQRPHIWCGCRGDGSPAVRPGSRLRATAGRRRRRFVGGQRPTTVLS